MTRKPNPPSVKETAFDCPHCGAFTTQTWFSLYASQYSNNTRTPVFPSEEFRKEITTGRDIPDEVRSNLLEWMNKMDLGHVFFERNKSGTYLNDSVNNLFLSACYNCHKISVWVHENVLYPPTKNGVIGNDDLPDEILADYEEARSIVDLSPRGAAALLRLCVQKLCIHLGEKGRNIDDDIASFVSKGLNPIVQKSLDVVRVIGNEAVHPGVIDLKDDRDTAIALFNLVNLIVEQMISVPKSIDLMYAKLPPSKLGAIEIRNEKAKFKN